MKRIIFLKVFFLFFLLVSASAVEINLTLSDGWITFNLKNQKDLGGIAMALKFADPGDDVFCDSFSFADTRLSSFAFKDVIIDNDAKTILIFAVVLEEDYIPSGEGALAKLKFSGEDSLEFETTNINRQEGISVVSSGAEELPFEFDPVLVGIEEEGKTGLPSQFTLFQNHPNPFNPYTDIRYALPKGSYVNLVVYNILGQKVKTLVDKNQRGGFHTVRWDGKNQRGQQVGTGIYFYKIEAGSFTQTKKMLLLK